MKPCKQCGVEKPLAGFPKAATCRDGTRHTCKMCEWERAKSRGRCPKKARDAQRKHRYGIDGAEFLTLWERQKGLCKICEVAMIEHVGRGGQERARVVCVDHCHTSGHVRGLLCHRCNAAIGLFDDNVERLQSAREYLKNV